jgi:hypothetical protein
MSVTGRRNQSFQRVRILECNYLGLSLDCDKSSPRQKSIRANVPDDVPFSEVPLHAILFALAGREKEEVLFAILEKSLDICLLITLRKIVLGILLQLRLGLMATTLFVAYIPHREGG